MHHLAEAGMQACSTCASAGAVVLASAALSSDLSISRDLVGKEQES